MKPLKTISFACLLTPIASQAAIVGGWGVEASAGTAGNCPSYCTGGQFSNSSDGGEFVSTAYTSDDTYAFGQSSVSLSGDYALPELRAEASADLGRRGSATAFGIQGYTYTGASSTSITLDLELTGEVHNNPNGYAYNTISSSVAVAFGNDIPFYTHFATLIYEIISGQVEATSSMGTASEGPAYENDQITFTLSPGDEFFVIAQLSASSNNGYADAYSTLAGTFLDIDGNPFDETLLTAAATAVPVPASAWFFISGLAALGLRKRTMR